MSISITPKDLLDAGVHFGHQTKRWNPRSKPFIFDHRQGITIIDLAKTFENLEKACAFVENAVANGGVFVSPRLVRGTVAANGSVTAAAASESHRVIDPTTNAELVSMLESVVSAGTGTSAAIDGYTVAGKTGTAQIPSADHLGYVPGAYIGSFAGFAPAQHPVLSAIVVLDHPTPIYGGAVAAPVFSTIMSYALHHFGVPTTAAATTAASASAVGGAGSVTVPAGAVTEGP